MGGLEFMKRLRGGGGEGSDSNRIWLCTFCKGYGKSKPMKIVKIWSIDSELGTHTNIQKIFYILYVL